MKKLQTFFFDKIIIFDHFLMVNVKKNNLQPT